MDCTTVQLGPDQTVIQGTQVDQTTVKIQQTASTTIQDDCPISLVVDSRTRAATRVVTGLTTQTALESTKIVFPDVKIIEIDTGSGGGTIDPCDIDNVTLTYNPDGTLATVNRDGFIVNLSYTGDLLTQIDKPDCSYQLNYNPDDTLGSVVKL